MVSITGKALPKSLKANLKKSEREIPKETPCFSGNEFRARCATDIVQSHSFFVRLTSSNNHLFLEMSKYLIRDKSRPKVRIERT